jgi:hypothetical protein
MRTAPRNGWTHCLVLYQRHDGRHLGRGFEDAGMEVNQAVYVPDAKQWRIHYQPVMFEPFCGQINEESVLAWMSLPERPHGCGPLMRRKQQAYYKRRDARWRKEGILKD